MTLIILMYALFATSFPIAKVLLQYTSAAFLSGLRLSIAGSLLFLYHVIALKKPFRIKKKDILDYVQITFLGFYLSYIMRFWSLEYIPTVKASLIYNLSPFFSALFCWILFNDTLTKKQWIGLLVGFVGIIPILLTSSLLELEFGEFFSVSWPECTMIISTALYTYAWVLVAKMLKDTHYSPLTLTSVAMFIAGLLGLVTTIYSKSENFIHTDNSSFFFFWLFILIIKGNLIGHYLYGYLLQFYSPTFISFASFLSPLFTALYAWSFLHETIHWEFFLSTAFVICGLYIFYQDELRKKRYLTP